MKINTQVEHYEYRNRYRNLTAEAKGVVKSEKFFPVYLKDGKEEIFKPISKTKPLATPLFAYSEVVWSTIINTYFDKEAPVYRLAICNGYSNEVAKYHNHGVIVPSVLKEGESLVNLLEYFQKHPDEAFDQADYVNYCMKYYDYSPVFNTKLIIENYELGKQLALQVLISILKADQNYHYENVSFICEGDKIKKFASPIDHEFSSIFIYLDYIDANKKLVEGFSKWLEIDKTKSPTEQILSKLYEQLPGVYTNLNIIVERYEETVKFFLERLEVLIYDLEHNPLYLKNDNYLYPFNSDNYKAGMAQYKNNNKEAADIILSSLEQVDVDIDEISKVVQEEILFIAKLLQKNLIHRLEEKHQKHYQLI